MTSEVLSYFRPVFEQSKTLKQPYYNADFVGYGMPVTKQNILTQLPSTGKDFLLTQKALEMKISPVEFQEARQGKFVNDRFQSRDFVSTAGTWAYLPIQTTYRDQSTTFFPIIPSKFQDPYLQAKQIEREIRQQKPKLMF
jgi:hypothetical protein